MEVQVGVVEVPLQISRNGRVGADLGSIRHDLEPAARSPGLAAVARGVEVTGVTACRLRVVLESGHDIERVPRVCGDARFVLLEGVRQAGIADQLDVRPERDPGASTGARDEAEMERPKDRGR